MLRVLLGTAPVRGETDRAALAVHSTMLEHGFVCVGVSEPNASAEPVLALSQDGDVTMQVLPAGWNASADSYTFGYIHPCRQSTDTFTVKALSIGSTLAVHAASSSAGSDLLNVTLNVDQNSTDNDPASVVARANDWQDKIAAGVALRLLGRQNSTALIGKSLQAEPEARDVAGGMKRSAPGDPRPVRPDFEDDFDRERRPVPGISPIRGDPFSPGFLGGDRPLLWTPDGGLLGPRHPAWGQVVPGRMGGGMMPRFDPIGPGMGDPNPDHAPVPGIPGMPGGGFPGGLPTFHGSGRGRMDPDGVFFM